MGGRQPQPMPAIVHKWNNEGEQHRNEAGDGWRRDGVDAKQVSVQAHLLWKNDFV